MTQVENGLIIREPWIDMILSGEKTWEMRSSNTTFRGWFGLIRQGTGTVAGVAELLSVSGPLTVSELRANIDRHRVPAHAIRGDVSSWSHAWRLGRVLRLRSPVPYHHKRGAVRWVQFDPEVTQAIAKQLAHGG
jgi:ASCH domain